nr:MAG TPA_asm: hypothetical protein [Caudoviricetes sp.]
MLAFSFSHPFPKTRPPKLIIKDAGQKVLCLLLLFMP